jgi:Lrp/AsnC family transcriptional regulator for asnA, asnC and gidA
MAFWCPKGHRKGEFTDRIETMSRTPRAKSAPLDETAKAIISQLQSDGRKSYSDIGKAIGLSEAAVRQRVQKLTESGILQIVAVTDPLQMGFNRQAMIGIRTNGDSRGLVEKLTEMREIDYVVLTAGSFDILVEVVCEDDDELIELLHSKIRTLPGVVETETFVYLKLHKQLYNWGTR